MKTKKIEMFVMDVDGTLTDGCTYYSERGEELKKFNMKDGFGISLLKHNDIIPVILTGENSKIVVSRAKKLNVKEAHVNVKDKLKTVSDIAFNYKVWLDVNVAYIGDDLRLPSTSITNILIFFIFNLHDPPLNIRL